MAETLNPNPALGTTWPLLNSDSFDRFFVSKLPQVVNGANANVSGQAYWVYVGYMDQPRLFQGITLQQSTIQGVGAQAAEVVFASTPVGPNRLSQTLTKLGNGDGSLSSLTSFTVAVIRPGAAMNTLVPANTHLWCGFRQALATTQAGFACLSVDAGQGAILVTAASGVLTGPGPWVGALAATSTNAQAPMMMATLD